LATPDPDSLQQGVIKGYIDYPASELAAIA
jgi:hypothetical protein